MDGAFSAAVLKSKVSMPKPHVAYRTPPGTFSSEINKKIHCFLYKKTYLYQIRNSRKHSEFKMPVFLAILPKHQNKNQSKAEYFLYLICHFGKF